MFNILVKERIRGFSNLVFRTKGGIRTPLFDMFVPRHNNILFIFEGPTYGKMLVPAHNIITDAGDIHYAQRAVAETLTNAFGILELGSAGTPGKSANRSSFTPISSTQKAHDATYPRRNDNDADNTGAGTRIVTFRTSYTAADFNATGIARGWITNTSPGASEPILTGFTLPNSPFDKSASDSLKVFTNHTMNGV